MNLNKCLCAGRTADVLQIYWICMRKLVSYFVLVGSILVWRTADAFPTPIRYTHNIFYGVIFFFIVETINVRIILL